MNDSYDSQLPLHQPYPLAGSNGQSHSNHMGSNQSYPFQGHLANQGYTNQGYINHGFGSYSVSPGIVPGRGALSSPISPHIPLRASLDNRNWGRYHPFPAADLTFRTKASV